MNGIIYIINDQWIFIIKTIMQEINRKKKNFFLTCMFFNIGKRSKKKTKNKKLLIPLKKNLS